jgi:hypothetical protein
METKGLTGSVRFDNFGLRNDFTLDLIEWQRGALVKTGVWDPKTGINHTMSYGEILDQIMENLQNKTFIVSSRIVNNYSYIK